MTDGFPTDLSTPGTSAPAAGVVAPAQDQRVLLHMPVDVRSISLVVLATLASLFVLRWASAVFIPLLLGLLSSYALSPVVDWMQRWHLPRALGAAVLLLAIVGGAGSMVYSLGDDAASLIGSLPVAAQKLRQSVRASRSKSAGALATVQKAATQLEQAAEESGAAKPPASPGVTRVQVEPARFNIKDYLWSGTVGLVSLLGQMLVVMFITYFLIVSGDVFRRKLVKVAGPTFSRKKITLQALDEITGQIQRYLLVQVFTSVLVGLATWLAFWGLGMEHAAVWGIVAGVLNLIPYIGSIAVAASSAMVSFLQFGTLEMAVVVALVSLVIHSIEGYVLTPWLTSRASSMNPVAIFVGVLTWGWLWGVWGLLLGVPILMVIKAVCDRVDDLKPVGEFLGA
ncbi:MAG: AI-2E family transporter [Burkholderiaceae bacterium]|nr:MAG: AI-2E family transporter [Burkholderiaceae bacterium]